MGTIEVKLETDSREYDILYQAALNSTVAPGASVELGVRQGGGSEIIMRAAANAPEEYKKLYGHRVHIGIDPWGDIPYILSGKDSGHRYSDAMRQQALRGLYDVAYDLKTDLLIFAMRDTDYFERFETSVPFYRNGKEEHITQYSFVHFDGPHNYEDIVQEVAFFAPRMSTQSWWVFDDVYLYDHARLEEQIFAAGFVPSDAPYSPARMNRVKASYQKIT